MTHVTIERAKLEQILEALESQHRDRLNYTLAKRSANATCAEFKVNTLSELIESGYMHGIGKQTESAITVAKQALAQPAVPLTDLGTLQAIVDEYYAWIRHHAAGHDYDDFLRNRGITASPEKGQQ